MEKNKIQSKQSTVTSIKWLCCVHVLEIVEMNDNVPENYIIRKNWKNLRVNEKQ
jgi:hypothetical protein